MHFKTRIQGYQLIMSPPPLASFASMALTMEETPDANVAPPPSPTLPRRFPKISAPGSLRLPADVGKSRAGAVSISKIKSESNHSANEARYVSEWTTSAALFGLCPRSKRSFVGDSESSSAPSKIVALDISAAGDVPSQICAGYSQELLKFLAETIFRKDSHD